MLCFIMLFIINGVNVITICSSIFRTGNISIIAKRAVILIAAKRLYDDRNKLSLELFGRRRCYTHYHLYYYMLMLVAWEVVGRQVVVLAFLDNMYLVPILDM